MRNSHWVTKALLLASAASLGCHHEESYQKPLTPVTVRVVESYSGAGGIRYSGNIQANAEVVVAFKVGGYVDEIRQVPGMDGRPRNLQEGDLVSKGTILARVRQKDYQDKVDQAKAQLAQTSAALEKAKLDFSRASALFASQSLTKPEFDAAKAQLDSTTASHEGAKAVVAEAEAALDYCSLRAPMDGVVLKRMVEMGSLVGPGSTAFSLADTNPVKVIFGVPDSVLPSLRPGQMLTVTTEALRGQQFRGLVSTVSPAADPRSRVFDVELQVSNPENQLKPGMIAALELRGVPLSTPVPVVPLSAIVRPQGNPNAYAVVVIEGQGEKQVARVRNIELGEAYGNAITIARGVRPGERVIVSGATVVADGEQVRVIP